MHFLASPLGYLGCLMSRSLSFFSFPILKKIAIIPNTHYHSSLSNSLFISLSVCLQLNTFFMLFHTISPNVTMLPDFSLTQGNFVEFSGSLSLSPDNPHRGSDGVGHVAAVVTLGGGAGWRPQEDWDHFQKVLNVNTSLFLCHKQSRIYSFSPT